MNAALAIHIASCLAATLDRRDLAAALARVKGIVTNHPSRPALAAVLLETTAGAMLLTGTDGSVFVRAAVGATVGARAQLLTPLRRLVEVTRGGRAPITLTADQLTAGGVTHRLAAMPTADFPDVPTPRGTVLFTLLRATLGRVLASTLHAVADDDTKPHLTAMLIERVGRELRFCATDGHRLAVARVPDDGADFSVLVGRTTIVELARMTAAPGGLVRLHRDAGRVWFVCADEWVSGPVVDATFPPYEQVIPAVSTGSFEVERDDLREALGALVARGRRTVAMTFNRTIGSVTLSTEDRAVTFRIGGELDPIRVDALGTTFVVMPMRF